MSITAWRLLTRMFKQNPPLIAIKTKVKCQQQVDNKSLANDIQHIKIKTIKGREDILV